MIELSPPPPIAYARIDCAAEYPNITHIRSDSVVVIVNYHPLPQVAFYKDRHIGKLDYPIYSILLLLRDTYEALSYGVMIIT